MAAFQGGFGCTGWSVVRCAEIVDRLARRLDSYIDITIKMADETVGMQNSQDIGRISGKTIAAHVE